MKKVILLMLGLAGLLAISACTSMLQQDNELSYVEGTVSYRERIALPPNAKVTVTLADVSKMDVAAEVLSQQAQLTEGKQVPFTFKLGYKTSDIIENHTYAVSARIEVDGKLMFITDTMNLVITDAAKTQQLDLMLIKTR
ncbi:lipoprotein-related protein [Photobacterium jeanii]|uniref:Lipoprotein-related protein n=2 Tax=Vibrionaceae TaxID=641 RepID=A0A178KPF8_9GAMM|nr:YbaY family lipoprotein [Photobacterium jeanii]OAN18553.1 lipoprotein-related protein [Photobacterium jeanii]PST91765.1 lipoprotein-related protein [Photobacterium jeanii]